MRRAWRFLRLLAELVHDLVIGGWWAGADIADAVEHEPALVVAGTCLGLAAVAAVHLVGDFLFGLAAIAALGALRGLAATRLRVLAGWALTAWGLYFLLSVSLLILALLAAGVAAAVDGRLF